MAPKLLVRVVHGLHLLSIPLHTKGEREIEIERDRERERERVRVREREERRLNLVCRKQGMVSFRGLQRVRPKQALHVAHEPHKALVGALIAIPLYQDVVQVPLQPVQALQQARPAPETRQTGQDRTGQDMTGQGWVDLFTACFARDYMHCIRIMEADKNIGL